MRPGEYATMFSVEDDYWWYLGLRDLLLEQMGRLAGESGRRRGFLDAGCGTGGLMAKCRRIPLYGIELSPEGTRFCRQRGLNRIAQASVCQLPFSDRSLDCVVSADVLCNLSEQDLAESLRELHRVLADNGVLLLNLPAHQWLMSTHDAAVHIRQRFSLRGLRRRLEATGFQIQRITYRNAILFPVAATIRLLKRATADREDASGSDLKPLPALLNSLLAHILYAENRLIRTGINFPVGLSIYCIAIKRA